MRDNTIKHTLENCIETKEVVGGYWVLQAKSKQQVIDWMKRCPAQPDDVIEIRPIAEMSDFPADA